jgi:hypothetical protein
MKTSKQLLLTVILNAIIFSVAAQNQVSPFDTTIYGRNEAVGKYLNTRGFKMYYETYGEGEPLLIIHGNGGSINNFLYQIPYFPKAIR